MNGRLRHAALLFAALACGAATAEPVAIVHARLYTMETAEPIENATLVIENGRVRQVGAGLAPPPGAQVIDATGRIVTPGLMSGGTQLGLVEVSSVPDTVDHSVASGALGAAFDVQYALNLNSTLLPLARADGLAHAVSYPGGSAVAPFLGQAAIVSLAPGGEPLERAGAAMFARIGGMEAKGAGGSRSAAWQLLRNALDEARRYRAPRGVGGPRDQLLNRLDAEALQPVVTGRMPLALLVDRESDIRQAMRLRDDYGIPVIIFGGAEAWRVAAELAARDIAVVLDATLNVPRSFDGLGARLDAAALLAQAGVRIAFAVSALQRTYNAGAGVREGAGLAVANGLPWIDGLRALTSGPAAIFGLADRYGALRPGMDADFVIWDGDPLEPATRALQVWMLGAPVSLESRQRELARRYAPTRRQDWPAAYQ